MSNAVVSPGEASAAADGHAGHNHDPHLAHHFDTPEQQYISAKLGMWIFLGTEILMFGGLFCAYAVYRHNHPDVFEYAHQFLNKWLGAVNTLVLITSSLTMAWAVRSSQLGDSKTLRWLLAVTVIGGYVFLGIKSIEYHAKWEEAIFVGANNQFRAKYTGERPILDEEQKADNEREIAARHGHQEAAAATEPSEGPRVGLAPPAGEPVKSQPPMSAPATAPANVSALTDATSLTPADPNASTGDAASIRPPFVQPVGLQASVAPPHEQMALKDLSILDQKQVYTFFGVYFVMTGLHGVHVVVGMALITWVLLRSMGPRLRAWAIPLIPASFGVFLSVVGLIIGGHAGQGLLIAGLVIATACVIWAMIWAPMRRNMSSEGEFGPTYFTPVDLVGLYWHLVDLIWIFLFPLLYLIH